MWFSTKIADRLFVRTKASELRYLQKKFSGGKVYSNLDFLQILPLRYWGFETKWTTDNVALKITSKSLISVHNFNFLKADLCLSIFFYCLDKLNFWQRRTTQFNLVVQNRKKALFTALFIISDFSLNTV